MRTPSAFFFSSLQKNTAAAAPSNPLQLSNSTATTFACSRWRHHDDPLDEMTLFCHSPSLAVRRNTAIHEELSNRPPSARGSAPPWVLTHVSSLCLALPFPTWSEPGAHGIVGGLDQPEIRPPWLGKLQAFRTDNFWKVKIEYFLKIVFFFVSPYLFGELANNNIWKEKNKKLLKILLEFGVFEVSGSWQPSRLRG